MEKTYLIYMLTQTLEQMDGKSERNCMKPENTHTHNCFVVYFLPGGNYSVLWLIRKQFEDFSIQGAILVSDISWGMC